MILELELEFEELDLVFDEEPAPVRSGFALRDYQLGACDAVEEAFKEAATVYIELATGTGKTVVFSELIRRVIARGGKALVLAHTEELLDQAADKLHRTTGIRAEKEKAEYRASHHDQIVVASVQTLCRTGRLRLWPPGHFDMIIVDECHRSLAKSYQKILKYFLHGDETIDKPDHTLTQPLTKVLGVTATADRGDKRSLSEFYEVKAYSYNLLSACRDGYLVRPIVKQVPVEIDLRGVHSRGGDFALDEVSSRIEPFLGQIAQLLATEAGARKTVIFLPSIATARMLSEALQALGKRANYVSGECQDRTEKIRAFSKNQTQFLANAMLLTEGWDDDGVSCVCVLRPTKIRSLYAQCVGRGTRPLTGVLEGLETAEERLAAIAGSGKPNMLILDMLWLTDRLNLIAPADLVTQGRKRDAIVKKKEEEYDLLDAEDNAERDVLESMKREAQKHSKRKGRVVDPLAFAVSIGDAALADWSPEAQWETKPVSQEQARALEKAGIDPGKVSCRGQASQLLSRVKLRRDMGLFSAKQMTFLESRGYRDAATIPFDQASKIIGQFLAEKRRGS